MCDGDASFCSCRVNSEHVHLEIPDDFRDDERERYLLTGRSRAARVLGYALNAPLYYIKTESAINAICNSNVE